MKHIVLTGGGTAGHVTPNIALIPRLKELGYEISYIGSYDGIEKKLIEEMNIPYYGISSGKLRRYFDLKNFTDPFRVLKGFGEAKKLLKQLKPDVVFSKGGFVTVPVVIAAGEHNMFHRDSSCFILNSYNNSIKDCREYVKSCENVRIHYFMELLYVTI